MMLISGKTEDDLNALYYYSYNLAFTGRVAY